MKKILLLLSILLLPALLLSCSEISVTNPKWTCEKSKQTCNVTFSVVSKSDASASTVILIRAYDRTGKGVRSSILMGEKIIKIILSPNEPFFVNETLIVNGHVTMVVATITNDKRLLHNNQVKGAEPNTINNPTHSISF